MPPDHRPPDLLSPLAVSPAGMRKLLVSILPAAALVPIASTIVAVALPAIMDDLGLGASAVWWLVTGYLLLAATLQAPAGRLGDVLGQRRLLLAGTILLGVASAAAALAPGSVHLVVARLVQGVAGAAVVPAGLAVIRRRVPDGARGRAVGGFMASMAGGGVIGVVAGGIVVAAGGWQAAFAALAVASAVAVLPQLMSDPECASAPPSEEMPRPTQPWLTVVSSVAGVALVNLAFYVVLLVVPLHLEAEDSSTVASGLLLGVFIIASAGGALTAARVSAWVGRRLSLRIEAGAAGMALLGLALGPARIAWLAGGLILAGAGLGMLLSGLFTLGLAGAKRQTAGATSGLLSTARYVGSIIGTAALPLLLGLGGATAGMLLASGATILVTALPWRGPAQRPQASAHPQTTTSAGVGRHGPAPPS